MRSEKRTKNQHPEQGPPQYSCFARDFLSSLPLNACTFHHGLPGISQLTGRRGLSLELSFPTASVTSVGETVDGYWRCFSEQAYNCVCGI